MNKYWKVIVAAVVSYFTFGAASGWAASWALGSGYGPSAAGFIGAVAGGAAAGFVSGAIITGSLKGALKGAFTGAVTAGVFEGIAQYGFNTSTVGDAATAMKLEQAGVSKDTIAYLYGNNGNEIIISKELYWNAIKNGAGKFTNAQAEQLNSLVTDIQSSTNAKIKLFAQNNDNANVLKYFGSIKENNTISYRLEKMFDISNKLTSKSFVSVNGLCGNGAFACVVPARSNHIFLESSFFNAEALAYEGVTQANILTHEIAHLAGVGHFIPNATIAINTYHQTPDAVRDAERYARYIVGN